VIATGALASVAITLIALVLVPAARRWDDRRSTIAAAGERVRRYEALLGAEPGLKQEMEQRLVAAHALTGCGDRRPAIIPPASGGHEHERDERDRDRRQSAGRDHAPLARATACQPAGKRC